MRRTKFRSHAQYVRQAHFKTLMRYSYSFLIVATTGIWVYGVMNINSKTLTPSEVSYPTQGVLGVDEKFDVSSTLKPLDCPFQTPVKGIITSVGDKLQYAITSDSYSKIRPDACFESVEAASQAGFVALPNLVEKSISSSASLSSREY